MGDKMKRNICVSSDLDVDTLDWEFLSIIGLWQLFYFITNYHRPVEPRTTVTSPANSSSESSDLVLFLGKNWHNILSLQPAASQPPVPQPNQCEAAGWLVRGQAASDWSRGWGRGWQGERLAWYWRTAPGLWVSWLCQLAWHYWADYGQLSLTGLVVVVEAESWSWSHPGSTVEVSPRCGADSLEGRHETERQDHGKTQSSTRQLAAAWAAKFFQIQWLEDILTCEHWIW